MHIQLQQDRTLKKLIEINEIFISIFEAMPMAVLQYINNYELNQWHTHGSLNWFIILSFASSVASVFYNIFILSHWMFDSEIKSFFDLLTCMMESAKGKKEEKVKKVFQFFDIPSKVLITSSNQLKKMALLKPDRYERIKQLHIYLPNHKSSFLQLVHDMHIVLQNLKLQNRVLQAFSLNLSQCNMKEKDTEELVIQLRELQAELKFINLKQTQSDMVLFNHEKDLIVERTMNMKIGGNLFISTDEFLLTRIGDQKKINELQEFLAQHEINVETIENMNINKNIFVNIHQEKEYTLDQLKNLLSQKEESIVQLNISLSNINRDYQYICDESYHLNFPKYIESVYFLQINTETMEFSKLFKQLQKNFGDNYDNGIVINANLQYNPSANLLELLYYFLSLYKLDTQQKMYQKEKTRQIILDNELTIDYSNIVYGDNEMLSAKPIIRKDNNQQPNNILGSVFIKNIKDESLQINEEFRISEKILFQRIKIDDSILIGCSKELFDPDELLKYLREEEGNYSCLFFFLDFDISIEFILLLQQQLYEYFQSMNNLRYLHMIIGESGSFLIDLNEHFQFIENVLVFQNDLFQLKCSLAKHSQKNVIDDCFNDTDILLKQQNSIIIKNSFDKSPKLQSKPEKQKPYRIYTYADLISDQYEADLQIAQSDPYVQIILKTARKGLDVSKYTIQSEIQQKLFNIEKNICNKLNSDQIKFDGQEIQLPINIPPLCARLLPQALKQLVGVKKLSIYDNVNGEIQDFLENNCTTLEYLKIKNSKMEVCGCGRKHQKNKQNAEFVCPEQNNIQCFDGVIYRCHPSQVLEINNLKSLKYLNITQSQMYQYIEFDDLIESINSLSERLQVLKLGFQNSNIFFSKQIQDYLCNTCVLKTFELNATDNYKFYGLEYIIKGLSFNFLIKNIGIRISSHQIKKSDMILILDLLIKRRQKGDLQSFKFYLKKYSSLKAKKQPSEQLFLRFFNEMIENITYLPNIQKIFLSYRQFQSTISYQDLPNLPKLILNNNYKKIKINLMGNTLSQDFIIQEEVNQNNNIQTNNIIQVNQTNNIQFNQMNNISFSQLDNNLQFNQINNIQVNQINNIQYNQVYNCQFNPKRQKLIFKADRYESIPNNHIINKILQIDYLTKALTFSFDILNQAKSHVLFNGHKIYLNFVTGQNIVNINQIKFCSNLNKLVLDFEDNLYISFSEIMSLIKILKNENQQLQSLIILIPQNIKNSNQLQLIKKALLQFTNYSSQDFVVQ